MKTYNSSWNVKGLSVNFNQKQWRQDFGAFIKSKLFWDGTTRVSRAKVPNKGVPNLTAKGIKQFEVYNRYGESVIIRYQNESEVLYTTHENLVKQYFEERSIEVYGK